MSRMHFIVASVISLLCLLFIIIRWNWPNILFDEKMLILIAMGIFPWLTIFFKRFKIGPVEGETPWRLQGTTVRPIPPKESRVSVLDISLNEDAKKILATLWRYQKLTFKDDKIKRWTFRVFSISPQYVSYLSGIVELLQYGLISINPENDQCMLTNEGLDFIGKNIPLQDYEDIYKF